MKILSFGHIPSWVGGRQESGLANVIYQVAKNMSDFDNVQMAMVATDVYVPFKQDNKLTIYGWTKNTLVRYALVHPLLSLGWLFFVLYVKCRFYAVINIPGFFFKGLHLARAISVANPDVVHLHGMTACVYEKIIPKGIKIVVTMHGIVGKNQTIQNQRSLYKMEREVCYSKRYSFIVFIANKLIADFKNTYGNIYASCKCILNAYDSDVFHYIEHIAQPKLTLATIASLSDNKGQIRVLNAMASLGLDIKYICIGDGSVELIEHNQNYAEMHNVDYFYAGKKQPSEIREMLASIDYMILPSSTEGFGLVYLESIACGVPVILPKHLPIVQQKGLIKPGVNAILLEDSSVEAIEKVFLNLPSKHFDHKAVAESIADYSWKSIAQQYIESIKEVLYESEN